MASLTHNLCFGWLGDFDSLKQFVGDVLGLSGVWEQPGGDKKIFKTDNTSIVWRKSKCALQIEGAEVNKITQLFYLKIGENLNPGCESTDISIVNKTTTSSQTERVISKSDSCEAVINDTEELKSGQDSNRKAIQSVSDSILHLTEAVSNLQENLARNRNNNGKSVGNLHPSQNMNLENTQNNTIVIDSPCASNDPEESQTSDLNNTDIEITTHPNNPSSSIQNLTAKPNNESPILIIGDSIIKNIDPRKISKRRVIKRTFPGKTAIEIKAEVKTIKVDSPPSHILVHAETNDIPVDSDNNCIKNMRSLALSIKERFPDSKIGISSIIVRYDAELNDRISRVNKQLQELCVKNGFDFINNSNMDNTCLNGSQLHLNAKGSAFLATNFIKFLRGSNANVKSSYRNHRNGDFRRTQPARLHLLEDLLRLISMPIS